MNEGTKNQLLCAKSFFKYHTYLDQGRAISQAVSRRLHTAAARVRAQVKSRGICGGQSGNEAGFIRVLRFPLSILIPPTATHIIYRPGLVQ
jgi:hypothetical protein